MLHVGRRVVPTDLYQLAFKVPNFQEPTSGLILEDSGEKGKIKTVSFDIS